MKKKRDRDKPTLEKLASEYSQLLLLKERGDGERGNQSLRQIQPAHTRLKREEKKKEN